MYYNAQVSPPEGRPYPYLHCGLKKGKLDYEILTRSIPYLPTLYLGA